ncbi:F-box/kelch-repeat protein At3g06240-like [Cornus florida]|uniref:F-box/kelch-repeat protein At3g06240-like n=1 Tax=Cornus florida TaxID=4283 RepID=UPI00289BF741|nr:F-box/kelch-repeat protein At3g06240-like [Cornus florida]
MLCDFAEFELPLYSFPNEYFRIIGSCNGIVCLSDDLSCYMDGLYLWNPSIQKTMALPPVRVTFESHGPFMHSIGFGFDSQTDDYKVVRIVFLDDGGFGFQTPPEVDIFSLSTGTWRNISHLGLQHTIWERASQAFLNGATHWFACNLTKGSKSVNLIVSFHMGDEVFSEIKAPGSIVHNNWLQRYRVAKFQESLSLIDMDTGANRCYVWVMKEYGVSESWTNLFNIDLSGGLGNRVAGFTRKGEVLFAKKTGHLVAYDPETEQVMHVHFRGSTDSWDGDSFYADAYTESLVLVTCKESPVLLEEMREKKQYVEKQVREKNEKMSKIKPERERTGL